MTILIILSWLVLLYGLVGAIAQFFTVDVYDETLRRKVPKKVELPFWLISVVGGFILVVLFSMIVKVGGQEVGVKVTPKGVDQDELQTGWHIVAPWNDVYFMDKTVWVYTFAKQGKDKQANADAIWSPTADGFKLGYDVSITWRIDPTNAAWIYANVSEQDGSDFGRYSWIEENIIKAYANSALTSVTKDYKVIDAYSTRRDDIQIECWKC